jgi:hypothetical protein
LERTIISELIMINRTFAFIIFGIAGSFVSLGCGRSEKPPKGPDAVALPGRAPAPHASLAESARVLAGTWRCSGSLYGGDGTAGPSEAALHVGLDLDEAWLKAEIAISSGKHEYEFHSYRRFDTASSQWVNVIMDNMGGHAVSRSTDGITWTGESTGPMGAMAIRDTEAIVSPGEMKMLGQYSLDGKTWSTGYELSCKK